MQKIWHAVCALGLGIIALAGPVLGAFPETGHSVSPGYGAPIYAFEMATNVADLNAIFGPQDDPLRVLRISQMDKGNRWDFAFMATYGSFMFLFFCAVWQNTTQRIWLLFAGIGLLSGCADAIENMILLNLTSNLAQAPFLEWLGFPVWTKFLSIMICIAAAGIYLLTQPALLWRVLGVSSLLGALTLCIAFVEPATYAYLIGTGTTLGWVAMLWFAGAQALSNRHQTNPSQL